MSLFENVTTTAVIIVVSNLPLKGFVSKCYFPTIKEKERHLIMTYFLRWDEQALYIMN